jgi:hypothetical protein
VYSRPRAIPSVAHRSLGVAPHNPYVADEHRRVLERIDGEAEVIFVVRAPLRDALLRRSL